ncbi:MAG: HAMP domain-containing protein [Saprospiraceae bacterium]|nr:HAMP domain-containing protein [Saprospiraceae bacterium]MCF8252105.1 HAMP domain-containing protein [Saprospiraceae bacterium]MCF8282462.1 HAMP domain-containing protein [Bacteroidales bacterium]MCF8313748.1 HAMP domain-containing protein [Saprospiraceae bacterium]MCF8442445.1 HAMP domain-containing protein [Saprospiraceae bacterium]
MSDEQGNMAALKDKLPQFARLFRRKIGHSFRALRSMTRTEARERLRSLRLKTKIILVLLALFMVVTLLGMLGGYYVQRTSTNSLLMLQENYQAIKYTRGMSKAVNDMLVILTLENTAPAYRNQQFRMASDDFERNLNMQLNKITAKEEQELTAHLKQDFERFRDTLKRVAATKEVTINIFMQKTYIDEMLKSVHDLNEKMIQQRTQEANKIANQVTLGMVILGALFFLFAVIAMFYFPSYLADPIQSMTESIRQIARKNYSLRIPIESNDEFGEMAKSFNLMAEKLEEYENINMSQVLSEKKRTETIVSRMNEAIIGLDDRKNILFANPPALGLIGLLSENLIGQNARQLARQHPLLQGLLKEVLNNEVKASRTFPAISVDKNGKRHYYDKDVLRIESHSDDPDTPTSVGYVIILKNVTELKEQDLAKTNFMATLSHELKTPIAAIDMSVNLLEDERIGSMNPEQWDLTGTIRLNTSRILKMVNEILDISRIETGQLHLELETVTPDTIVMRSLDNVKTFIAEKNVGVIQQIAPDLPALNVDLHKTTAVLVNLLTNAVRYSPENEAIVIKVERLNDLVQFSIKDKGPGITEEEQRKLFQPYRRAAGDKTKGTGLGLAISKEFVEAQGGHIWVKSKVGKGSTFGFTLPVA